ncbi:PDR ABC-type transporter family protein [Tanacetum coccineum]
MARRRQRRGTGVRTHATEEESTGIQNGSTINVYINETSPANVTANMTDSLHNPSLPEGRKPIRKHFVWDLEIETNVREAWDSKSSSRYTDFLRDIRDKNVKPVFMTDDAWRDFTSYWGTPKYKEIQEKNTQNHLKGEGSSTHVRGSISFRDHAQNIGYDKKTFINKKSKTINARKGGKSTSTESQVDETTLYIAAANGAKKRNMYGVGLKRSDYLKDSGNETPIISKAYDGWEKKSLKMERKINKSNKTLEIVCSHFNITLSDCDSYSENNEAANEEYVPTHSNDPLLSGEYSLKLNDLMEICIKLQQRVLDLENTKTTQAHKISSLKLRVKRLEKKGGSRTHKLKRLFKVTLVDETQGRYGDDLVFDTSVLDGEVVTTASVEVSAATTTTTTATTTVADEVEMTLAQTLIEIKSAKSKAVTIAATTTITAVTRPKAKGLVVQEQEQASTPITSSKDKVKVIMVEEPLKMKKKYQVLFDEQEALRLQAQFDEEERIAREKEEANDVLIAQ